MSIEKLVDKNMECIICLDLIDLEKQELEIFKECEHKNNYHEECINNWVDECVDKNIRPSCPICRKKLEIIEIDNTIVEHNNQRQIIIINEVQPVQVQTERLFPQQGSCCVCILCIIISIVIINFIMESILKMKY